MNQQLLQYINFARDRQVKDQDIRANLIGAGWEVGQVDAALSAGPDAAILPPPPPAPAASSAGVMVGMAAPGPAVGAPIAVVQQRTTKGLEYTIMFLALGASAISLGALLHDMVSSGIGGDAGSSDVVSFAASAIIVALPIFAVLFLRLKKAELANPGIRSDASRRHAVQLTLIVTFLWGLGRLIAYIYSLLNSGAGDSSFLGSDNSSPAANLLHTLITLTIAGGIFGYYWFDEHRKDQV